MKAVLKIAWPSGSPAMTGTIASRIDIAPRRPTHEMKATLVAAEAERQEAEPDRDRPGEERQEDRERERRDHHRRELRGRREQAEGQEHGDLGEPGRRPPGSAAAPTAWRMRALPATSPATIDGEEAAPLEQCR